MVAERKLRYLRLTTGGLGKVVILDGFVRQVLAIKKTKKGAQSLAEKWRKQKWRGYWWNFRVVKTDKGYAVVGIPKRISKEQDIKYNSVEALKHRLVDNP